MERDATWRDPSWRPNLFVPGFPKCGTTALCDYLRQHPDIYMMEPKEPKTLAVGVEGPGWLVRHRTFAKPYTHLTDPAVYRRKFEQAKGFRYRAEGSQAYIYPPQFPGRLKRFAPDAKLIFMIREQKSRVRSIYAFGLGLHHEPDFERWVEKRFRPFLNMVFFEGMMRAYHDSYGDSMRVVENEELLRAPGEVMSKVFGFLGLEDVKVTPLRSNVSRMKTYDEYQRRRVVPYFRLKNLAVPMKWFMTIADPSGESRMRRPLRRLSPLRGLRSAQRFGGREQAPVRDRGVKDEDIPEDIVQALDSDYASTVEYCKSSGLFLR